MKYFVQINLGPKARDWRSLSPEAATTVRVADHAIQTSNGPIGDADTALDGYFILEADSLEQAIDVAARVPAASMGGAIEVRPTVEW